jgi:toxin ParE1/3/4
MKINLSDEAQLDLQEIAAYTWAEWGEEQEEKYLKLLYDTLQKIETKHVRARNREDLYHGCKMILAGKHAIFFRIELDTIHVARILHQAMDPYRHIQLDS